MMSLTPWRMPYGCYEVPAAMSTRLILTLAVIACGAALTSSVRFDENGDFISEGDDLPPNSAVDSEMERLTNGHPVNRYDADGVRYPRSSRQNLRERGQVIQRDVFAALALANKTDAIAHIPLR